MNINWEFCSNFFIHKTVIQYLSTASIDAFICSFVGCVFARWQWWYGNIYNGCSTKAAVKASYDHTWSLAIWLKLSIWFDNWLCWHAGCCIAGVPGIVWHVQVNQLLVIRQLACCRPVSHRFALLPLETPECSSTNQSTAFYWCRDSNRSSSIAAFTTTTLYLRQSVWASTRTLRNISPTTTCLLGICQSIARLEG